MADLSPYLHGLYPWYGLGGHEEVTDEDTAFVHGKEHDYRTRKLGAEDFVAEQRPRGGAWKELSRGHKTAYVAGIACAAAEGRARGVQTPAPPPAPMMLERLLEEQPGAEVLTVTAPRKLSAVERLKAASSPK